MDKQVEAATRQTKVKKSNVKVRESSVKEESASNPNSALNSKKNVSPPKLELFGGDTVGYCDPETGLCTVPEPIHAPSTDDERPKRVSKEDAPDGGKAM